MDGVNRQFTEEMLRAMYNVRKRRQHEIQQHEDLMHTYKNKPDTLTESQRKQLRQLNDVVNRLDKAILQLDQTLIVLKDI